MTAAARCTRRAPEGIEAPNCGPPPLRWVRSSDPGVLVRFEASQGVSCSPRMRVSSFNEFGPRSSELVELGDIDVLTLYVNELVAAKQWDELSSPAREVPAGSGAG